MNKIITIDARMIRMSGIGTYIKQILPLIIENLNAVHINLIGDSKYITNFEWAQHPNVHCTNCTSPIYSIGEQVKLLKAIGNANALLWSPHYNIPIMYKGKLIVTVHDVFHLAARQYVNGILKRVYAKSLFSAVKHKADAVLCVSNFTKNEFIKYTGCREEKIHVIHNGISPVWFSKYTGERPNNRPYLLYVGNVKPHKNLRRLFEAFEQIRNSVKHDLVIVGQKEGFITGDSTVLGYADKYKGRVKFTGYVDDDKLKSYYAYADCLVFPSLYEGFGLPPLEAMACGCPVLVSNCASLPEVCGNAALYCDPYNERDIADKILSLIYNRQLRENLRQKGILHAKKFSWAKCAEQSIKVMEKVLRQ